MAWKLGPAPPPRREASHLPPTLMKTMHVAKILRGESLIEQRLLLQRESLDMMAVVTRAHRAGRGTCSMRTPQRRQCTRYGA
jgi:hypothetical protein